MVGVVPRLPGLRGGGTVTRDEYEAQQRRVAADTEAARQTYIRAKALYDRLCDEQRDLRIAWREQQRKDGA